MPSISEGFGLPLVEASQRGLAIMCSDIPVFHEVADDNAIFFDLDDPEDLARDLLNFVPRTSSTQRWITWEDSTRQLIDRVVDLAWPINPSKHTSAAATDSAAVDIQYAKAQ